MSFVSGRFTSLTLPFTAYVLVCLVLTGSSASPAFDGNRVDLPREQEAKIYMTPLPQEFHGWPAEQLWGFRGLGSVVDINHSLWSADWHAVDKWWINQLNISPLRTADPDEADFIFVPATIRYLSTYTSSTCVFDKTCRQLREIWRADTIKQTC